jgi:MFS family permease
MHDAGAESGEPAAAAPSTKAASDESDDGAFVRLIVATWRSTARGVRRAREWNKRDGAGDSGLAALVETHALQAAGDATIAVALAGSLFFSVSPDAARSKIGLYLLVTMLPFAVVAPVIGPMLDRFRRGRRLALAASMVVRAVLALAIGHSLTHSGHTSATEALTLYPAALGVLVASRTYGVARSAAVPRLVPEGMTLVQANSRLTLAGVLAPVAAGSIAAAVIKTLGSSTELFLGAVVYVLAAVMALRLPAATDGVDEEHDDGEAMAATGGLVRRSELTDAVRNALRSAAALRWLSGFMLFFGAFLVRIHPLAGLSANACLGLLALSIAAGNILGTTLGPRTATIAARRLSVALLGATVGVCVLTIFHFGLATIIALAVVGSAAAAVAKLALDGTIQRQIKEDVRTSVFARSETTLQLAWVIGGGIGILLPHHGSLGFAVAAVVLGFALILALGVLPRQKQKAS